MFKIMNEVKRQKGFTLIELMIVVAIIGILAAIAIPQFAAYRMRAYNAAAESDLHTAQTAFEVFFNDNSMYPDAIAGYNTLNLTAAAAGASVVGASLKLSNKDAFASSKGTNNQTYGAATKHDAGNKLFYTTSASPTQQSQTCAAGTVLTACASNNPPTAP